MATGLFNLKQVNQAISQGAWSGYIAPRWVEYLVVAGGAGGGGKAGGGGGAGGLLTGIVTVTAGTSYTVTVGSGGAGGGSTSTVGSSGLNSVFGSITATGGGGGGGSFTGAAGVYAGASGGSGGGAGLMNPGAPSGGSGVSGQGNSGGTTTTSYGGGADYSCSGGGGAGTVGINGLGAVGTGPRGGAGIASAISGTVITYAGGGGGFGSNTGGTGGVGGGGNGGINTTGGGAATAGSANTGGGGGGAGQDTGYNTGGTGGSGIVVVRYPGNVQFYTGGTVTYSNGYIVHNFTANGTLAPTTPTVVSEYQISRSLRFNSADSAYLNRTPASAGNRQIFTWSGWVKRSALGSSFFGLFGASTGANTYTGYWLRNDNLWLYSYTNPTENYSYQTTQLFRDVSAWYHLVIATDTTQATNTNRIKIYVNGSQVTALTVNTYPTQNFNDYIDNNVAHTLGWTDGGTGYYNGYMTEVNFIDGQQLTPTSFGYVNPTTGIWSPAKFVGGYGTNGFYLNFSDNSATTAATLGKDYSGNGNNWTPNNFSVSSGAGNDSLVDSPTSYGTDTGVGGTVRGNYATFNPLIKVVSQPTLSNGNLLSTAPAGWSSAVGTIGVTSGKWYWEIVNGNSDAFVGICGDNATLGTDAPQSSTGTILYYGNTGNKRIDTVDTAYGSAFSTQTIGVALDIDGGTIVFYRDNVSQGSISLSSSTLNGRTIFPLSGVISTTSTVNFGQRPFVYTAPSGFKALCTQNLPTPTIGATSATLAGKYFAPVLYSGNGATQSISGVGFQPDWVWIKARNVLANHALFDSVRGTGKVIQSNTTAAEATDNTTLTAFNSDGFSLGAAAGSYIVNTSTYTFVAWNWRASNATAVTNTSGSITSTVSANTTSGFSVVTYTGTGVAATVGHGLGVKPSMIILKNRSGAYDWPTWSQYLPNPTTQHFWLNATNAAQVSGSFNSTQPTSSVFSVGTTGEANANGNNFVAYCFAEVAGYSKIGSYTGNGSTDGPFVFTGMRPAFVMIKRTDSTANWHILDVSRNTYNVANLLLYPNLSSAEATFSTLDILSNGFKIRNSDVDFNASGGTYIYMAFASAPLKFSLAR